MLARHSFFTRYNASLLGNQAFTRKSSTLLKSSVNQPIIDLLNKHREVEQNKPASNIFRIQAYDNAILAISQLQIPIRSANDVLKVQGIGPGIAARINEHFLKDQTLSEIDPPLYQEMLKARAMKEISALPGIGSATAKKLVEAGCMYPEDLKLPQFSSMLSSKQLAKIKYSDSSTPIQRQDAQDVLIMVTHPHFVHVPLPTTPPPDSNASPTKRPRSKTKKVDENPNPLHTSIIPALQQRGLIAETFTSTTKSWEGIIRLPGPQSNWGSIADRIAAINNTQGSFKKMKIHIVSQKSRAASLICLTGDGDFEKDICYRARHRNMLFNEYGLWKWTLSPLEATPTLMPASTSAPTSTDSNSTTNDTHSFWSLVNCSTEEDIFKQLGMESIDPTRRNFSFINSKPRKKRTSVPPSTY
ncbi:putative DNA polymerase family X [Psilocybe cubensis]|uniref:DNA polymerase family X n=1 Tax=Psilocybe cubensis TaxID=181762 RepID=A0ACB8GYB0_PSICU|nr:putative DNA polymerase family X [Psilocybe cubensis]KAH9480638.1 putative DNA polymerase family X [Psilocybe cubensis]